MQIIKLFDVSVTKASKQEGVLHFVLTERVKDRDGDIIEPKGAKVDNFMKNPVFLWAHSLSTPPIGRVIPETLKIGTKRITADVEFDMKDPFAAEVYRKYKDGFMNAGSIRFWPSKYDYIKDEETERITGIHFKEWELLEFSAVPVPANPFALSRKEYSDAMEKGDKFLKSVFEILSDISAPTCESWAKSLETKDLKFVDTLCEKGVENEDKSENKEEVENKDFDGIGDTLETEQDEIVEQLKQVVEILETGQVIVSKDYYDKMVEAVKVLGELIPVVQKGTVPYAATTPADVNRKWDATQADKRVRVWASGGGDFDLSKAGVRNKYKQAFAYVDGDGTKVAHYKLPHHDVNNGKLVVVWRGVAAAMAALFGARGGVNIPDGDRKSVYNHLAKHYKQFDKNPPEFKSLESLDDQEKFFLDLILQDDGLRDELVTEIAKNLMED